VNLCWFFICISHVGRALLWMKVVVFKFLNDSLYFQVYGKAENEFCWTQFPIFPRTQLVGIGKERC
jgi:hypothetical protein